MKTLLLLSMLLAWTGTVRGADAPQAVLTKNAEAKSLAVEFARDFCMTRRDEGVRIESARRSLAGPGTSGAPTHDLTLRVGDEFLIPDHHSQRRFVVKAVTAAGIVLDYSDDFDARSFGRNEIRHDSGTIRVAWRS